MKLLVLTGTLYPQLGNNAVLVGKLIPYLLVAGHEVHLLSFAFGEKEAELPATSISVPVHWVTDQNRDWKRRLLFPVVSWLFDRKGYSDVLQLLIVLRKLKELQKVHSFDTLLPTLEPFSMACAASCFRSKNTVLFIMDPPIYSANNPRNRYRIRMLKRILIHSSLLVSTPFIQKALRSNNFNLPDSTLWVGFPAITPNRVKMPFRNDSRIHLLFCGWLYSDIRSPKYFLNILSRLDERFVVIFMGRECEKLTERFDVQTKAELITLPQQPYETALQAMADADIMINIGNSVPVHMPSKTLEYINTGKPFVNFYKMDDCPTLYYSKRYPLCLNLSEQDPDIDAAAQRFIEFCIDNKGKTVDRAFIESEYADCTPEYIAHKILDALGE